jgi:hypothetical protein
MNQKKPDVHCNKCDKIINREKIKEFLEEEEETEILKEFEERWTPEGKLFIFFLFLIFFFFNININRFSLEDIDKMKGGKCPYCNNAIIQQKECYKCENFLCSRNMTFKDVETSMNHPAKSSQQKSTAYPSSLPPPPSYSSSPYKPQMKQKYKTHPNKPTTNTTVKHQKIHENKPKFIVPNENKPTGTEQSALNKLSDEDHALEYLLYYFYFILFLDTLTKIWKKINVSKNSKVIMILMILSIIQVLYMITMNLLSTKKQNIKKEKKKKRMMMMMKIILCINDQNSKIVLKARKIKKQRKNKNG